MADNREGSAAGTHVQVAVRCRPLNSREKASGNLHVVNTEPSNNRIRVAHRKVDRTYQYDHVFGPFASQEEVFVSTVEPIVREMLQGFSTTVFAYGQTGTGKTHTMEGDITSPDNMGVIPRSVHAIFNYLDGISADYTVRTSFLELYNEELADLLADGNSKSKVVLREDTKRGVVCCGLEEVQVLSAKDIFTILGKGIQQRKTAETLMNKNSSRSHSIFTLKIMIKECMPDGQEVMRNGQLNLVDLAGSECVGRSGAKNVRAREAGNINQSLLTLGRVITALVEHHPHVPYRDSKLTRLLQESLGGRAKTCIIATVTASSDALEETLSSLDYANKAKSIQNKPVANQKLSKTHLLKEYAGEVESLRSMLQAARDKNGVYMEPWRFEHMESTLTSQANQIAEMESVLLSRSNETKELKADRDAFRSKGEELEDALKASRQQEETLSDSLAATEAQLQRTEKDLASSQALAAELQEKLAATEAQLQDTQVELSATRAVVGEQALTEKALLVEAAQVTGSLRAAEQDVEDLHAKVARQEEEAAGKRTQASSFGKSATAAADDVSEAVARFSGEHARACADLKEFLAKAEAAACAASGKLSSAGAEALKEAESLCKEMVGGVSAGAASIDERVASAASALEGVLEEQKKSIDLWSKEMSQSLNGLRNGLETHEGELSLLCEDVERRADETRKEMIAFREKSANELAEVRNWADERIAAQTEQMERQSEEAKLVAARSKEETKVEVAQLMESFSSLMSGLQRNAAARADSQATAAGEAWSRSISAARSLGPEVSQKMAGIAESVAGGSEVVVQKLALSSSSTVNTIKEHRSGAAGFVRSMGDVSDGFTSGAVRVSDFADVADSSLKENASAISEAVASTAGACVTSAETLSEATLDSVERIASLAASADKAAADLAQDGVAQVEGLTASVADLESRHASSLGSCLLHIEEHVEEACSVRGASGGTPDKRNYPRPEEFSTTRSHEIIMSEFRVANLDKVSLRSAQLEEEREVSTAGPCESSVGVLSATSAESRESEDSLPRDGGEGLTLENGPSEADVRDEAQEEGEEGQGEAQEQAAEQATPAPPREGTAMDQEGKADVDTDVDLLNDDCSSTGAENRLGGDRNSVDSRVSTKTASSLTGTDFEAMKADRALRIAARTSALRGEEGTRIPSPPLGEDANSSNKPRSKIPTVRRTSRRTRGAA